MQYVLSALGSLCRKSCRKLISVRRAWNKLFSNLQNIPSTITHLLCTSAQDKQCAEAFLIWEANATLLWRVAVEEGGVETFYWSLRHPPNKAHWGRGQRWSPIFYFFLIWDMKGKICSMIWIVKPHNSLFLVKLHKIKLCFFHNHHFLQFLSRPSWPSGQKPLLYALRGPCPALWWSASPFVYLYFFVQWFDQLCLLTRLWATWRQGPCRISAPHCMPSPSLVPGML